MASLGQGPALATHTTRVLTLDSKHPPGRPHLSAASGLVCVAGSAYVLADNEHHLARFTASSRVGVLARLILGDLPEPKPLRKRRKPDFETLCRCSWV